MAELLAYLARELVDDPEAVRVEEEERDGALVLVLHVAPDDVGKVIGRRGRIVRALRTRRARERRARGRRVLVEIADPVKVAALYDVHAMPCALEAVLAEVETSGVDVVLFGGDYPYGPFPAETVALARASRCARSSAATASDPPRSGTAPSSTATLRWLQRCR